MAWAGSQWSISNAAFEDLIERQLLFIVIVIVSSAMFTILKGNARGRVGGV